MAVKQDSKDLQQRARITLERLKKHYKVTGPFTQWRTPFELAVVTMLSAQCTDERVNKISPALFATYPTAREMARAPIAKLEKLLFSTGFYHAKARYAKGIGEVLMRDFGGEVPSDFDSLLTLPGISKKSACIILAKAFGKFVGVPVDTHVLRIAPRLGFTVSNNRDTQARDLEALFPAKDYLAINEYLITLGRDVCIPRVPKCGACVLRDVCDFSNGKG